MLSFLDRHSYVFVVAVVAIVAVVDAVFVAVVAVKFLAVDPIVIVITYI